MEKQGKATAVSSAAYVQHGQDGGESIVAVLEAPRGVWQVSTLTTGQSRTFQGQSILLTTPAALALRDLLNGLELEGPDLGDNLAIAE